MFLKEISKSHSGSGLRGFKSHPRTKKHLESGLNSLRKTGKTGLFCDKFGLFRLFEKLLGTHPYFVKRYLRSSRTRPCSQKCLKEAPINVICRFEGGTRPLGVISGPV